MTRQYIDQVKIKGNKAIFDIHNIHLDQVGRLGDLAVPHIGAVDEEESVISLKNFFLLNDNNKRENNNIGNMLA